MSKRMYHPCHKLSVPSAKLFWCRHCMQMFEDAISRWKHSKICRFNTGIKHKDQDGQVVQMYVKPDTVSYTQNSLPGQTVIHKPQIKKKTAELKCVICNTKFFSLYDMRMHVKFPCQKIYSSVGADNTDNTDSDSDIREDSVNYKIRRVEIENADSVVNSGTALSVLAEASKHVESLSHRYSFVRQVTQTGRQQLEQCLQTDSRVSAEIEIAPIYSDGNSFDQAPGTIYIDRRSEPVRPVVRKDLEPISIVIQAEGGEDLPEEALDQDSIIQYLKDSAQSFEVGQVLQVQIKQHTVKNYVVGPRGTIFPEYQVNPSLPLRISEVRTEQSTSQASTSTQVTEVQDTSTETDSSLLLAFLSEYNTNKEANRYTSAQVARTQVARTQVASTQVGSAQSDSETEVITESVEYFVPPSTQEHSDILSRSVKQEILDTNPENIVTITEHSYQLPNTASAQPGLVIDAQTQQLNTVSRQLGLVVDAQTQQSDQINQVRLDTLRAKERFSEIDLHNFVTLIQKSTPLAQNSGVVASSSVIPVQHPNQNSQASSLPVVIIGEVDSEVVQAGDILNNLVYTYAASDQT